MAHLARHARSVFFTNQGIGDDPEAHTHWTNVFLPVFKRLRAHGWSAATILSRHPWHPT